MPVRSRRTFTFAHGVMAASLSVASIGGDARAARPGPQRLPPGAPRLAVLDTLNASEREARARLPAHIDAVSRCVLAAQNADPVGLAAVTVAVAVVRLRADGQTEAVEISPSDLARGLSACLANELLTWQQPATAGPQATVRLVVNLRP